MGDRLIYLMEAKRRINEEIAPLTRQSSVYETAAWGITDQPSFYNQVVEGLTSSKPEDLMKTILNIENEMGRVRELKWSPRIIDIDILFFENEIIDKEQLHIPHPMFHLRKFTLIPLHEIMPDFIDPRSGKKILTLLEELEDTLEVRKIQ